MPLFICDKCGCVENTALGHYWCRDSDYVGFKDETLKGKALCSECTPPEYKDGSKSRGGRWHGKFKKELPTEEQIKRGDFINR